MNGLFYRIAKAAERTGLTPATIRAWENRYGLPKPHRSDSKYRLYSESDIHLLMAIKQLVDSGVGPQQAIPAVLAHQSADTGPAPEEPSLPQPLTGAAFWRARLAALVRKLEEPRVRLLVDIAEAMTATTNGAASESQPGTLEASDG